LLSSPLSLQVQPGTVAEQLWPEIENALHQNSSIRDVWDHVDFDFSKGPKLVMKATYERHGDQMQTWNA